MKKVNNVFSALSGDYGASFILYKTVFILYLDGVHHLGESDFTFIHEKRTSITENEKRWAKSIKEFYSCASVELVALKYSTWLNVDPKDFKKHALSKYTV